MRFVDTSAWYAAYVPVDANHAAVRESLFARGESLVTSDFVVDETMTLLIARHERARAVQFGRDVLTGGIALLEVVTLSDIRAAYDLVVRFNDKAWSFTDFTSLIVMQRLSIGDAVSLDRDFEQVPGTVVHPGH
jgi:predicted nucleic acid-binding protein